MDFFKSCSLYVYTTISMKISLILWASRKDPRAPVILRNRLPISDCHFQRKNEAEIYRKVKKFLGNDKVVCA